ncbi:MAG: tetratricopeptide repeat protein [Pyrinomonadaceae bacterium]
MAEHLISRADAESDILACAAYLAEDIKSRDGHAEAMAVIIPLYLEKGNVDLAAELANSVDDPFMRDRLLILVAQKCAGINDDEYALQLADSVEDYGLQSQAREKIAVQKAEQGNFEKAREISNDLDHPDSVYAAIAVKQMAAGDEAAANETLKGIAFPAAIVSAYSMMGVAKLETKDYAKAAEFLEKAVEAAGNTEHDEESIRTFCEIGNLLIEAQRNDRAIETFEKARGLAEELDNIHRDSFLAAVAVGFLHAGSVELADRTLDSITDKTQIATCLLSFARDSWRREEKDDAFDALEESYAILKSQHERETRDGKAKFRLFTSIAAQFAGFEKGERAVEIAQEIPDEAEQVSALSQIAQIMTLQQHDELARQAMSAIPEDAARVFALIGISDAHNKNGDKEAAMNAVNEASELTETVPHLASRSSAYNEIARRLKEYGEEGKSQEILQASLETITVIRDESSQAVALASAANVYEKFGFSFSDFDKNLIQSIITARVR